MISRVTFLLITLLLSLPGWTQHPLVTGRVLESGTDIPLRNVNVMIVKTKHGSHSDHLGYFELSITDSTREFIASHKGYKSLRLSAPVSGKFKFSMEREYKSIGNIYLKSLSRTVELEKKPTKEGLWVDDERAETDAWYPGGMDHFKDTVRWMLSRRIFSVRADLPVRFTVDETGSIVAISSPDSSSRANVVATLSSLRKWRPATQRGVPVKQHFSLLISAESGHPDVAALYQHLKSNFDIPNGALTGEETVTVLASITVASDGHLENFDLDGNGNKAVLSEITKTLRSVPRRIQ